VERGGGSATAGRVCRSACVHRHWLDQLGDVLGVDALAVGLLVRARVSVQGIDSAVCCDARRER